MLALSYLLWVDKRNGNEVSELGDIAHVDGTRIRAHRLGEGWGPVRSGLWNVHWASEVLVVERRFYKRNPLEACFLHDIIDPGLVGEVRYVKRVTGDLCDIWQR